MKQITPFSVALSQYGIKEISGKEDNPVIIDYFHDIGFEKEDWIKDETAWCSAFANWCAWKAGYEMTGKLNARSWLDVGEVVVVPEMGDIVVLWREDPTSWKGHVGFFVCERHGWIYILGGNQANQVKISAYPKKRLLEYRRLSTGAIV